MSSIQLVKSARGIAVAALLVGTASVSGCASNRTTTISNELTGSIGAPSSATGQAPAVAGKSMSVAQVVAYTVQSNPDIGIARAQSLDARAGVALAQVPYMPTVEYSAGFGPEHTYAYDTEIDTDANRQEAAVRASQLVFDFGKTSSDINRGKALEQSAKMRLQAKTNEITMAAVEAYLRVLELDMQIAISGRNVAAHEEMERIVSLNEQGGNGTMADVQKAMTRLEAARTQTLDLQAERRAAASAFERVTGLAPTSLQMPNPPAPKGTVSRESIALYAATDPLLLSLEQDKISLQAQKQALQLDYLPRLTIDGTAKLAVNVGGQNPARADARVMLALNGTLFDGGDRAAKIEQIDARIEETEYRYRRAVDNLEFDVDDSTRVLETASSRLASINEQIASGEQVVALYAQQFTAGTRGIFELLDAQQELSTSRSANVTGQFDVLRAIYRLLALTGELGRVSAP